MNKPELENVISKALLLIKEGKIKEAKELLNDSNNEINRSYE